LTCRQEVEQYRGIEDDRAREQCSPYLPPRG
jgi:hypothetical protein